MIKIKNKTFDFGDAVSTMLQDGKSFSGVLVGFYPADETYSGHDEIEIDEGGVFRTLEIEEIDAIAVKNAPLSV